MRYILICALPCHVTGEVRYLWIWARLSLTDNHIHAPWKLIFWIILEVSYEKYLDKADAAADLA